jgi:hypothetical protein
VVRLRFPLATSLGQSSFCFALRSQQGALGSTPEQFPLPAHPVLLPSEEQPLPMHDNPIPTLGPLLPSLLLDRTSSALGSGATLYVHSGQYFCDHIFKYAGRPPLRSLGHRWYQHLQVFMIHVAHVIPSRSVLRLCYRSRSLPDWLGRQSHTRSHACSPAGVEPQGCPHQYTCVKSFLTFQLAEGSEKRTTLASGTSNYLAHHV